MNLPNEPKETHKPQHDNTSASAQETQTNDPPDHPRVSEEIKKTETQKVSVDAVDPAPTTGKVSLLINPHFFMSVLFLLAYFMMLGAIIYIEASDHINMQKGDNSMMKELQILFGAITAGFGQVLNYWFSNGKK